MAASAEKPGRDVDHRAAGEVERPHLAEPADGSGLAVGLGIDRPDPVGQRVVDERGPQQDEQAVRPEADALGEGPADQGRRDDGEHALVHAVDEDRDVRAGEELVGHARRAGRGTRRPSRSSRPAMSPKARA